MNNKHLVRIMLVMIVFLSILIMVTACFPSGVDKSEDNNSKTSTENEVSSQVSPIAKIGQDQPFYDFYHQVEINQTKTEVDNVLGVEAVMDADGSYTYTDTSTGYSVNVVYSTSDLVTMKILIPPPGGGEWIKLTTVNVTESQVPSILEGMTYEEVTNILGGDGLEMGVMIYPGSNDEVLYLLIWFNPDLSSITVAFDSNFGKVFMAEFENAPV